MGAAYSELGPLGRDLAIWEIHLKSAGKSPHTVKSYIHGVRALAGFLTDQGLPLDPEQITTSQLRAFQAHLLLPTDQGGAGKRTSTVCTRHDSLKLFFAFLEDEDEIPNPMRRVQRPAEEEVTIQPLTEEQLAALIDTCRGKDFYDRRDMAILRMWVSTPARLSEIAMLRVVGHDGEPRRRSAGRDDLRDGQGPAAAADGAEPEGLQGRDPLREGPRAPSQRTIAVLLAVAQEGAVHPVGHPADGLAPRA